ncbi:unnamed protein product [Tilletia controversa]|uniref:Transcription factor TFIIIC subunit tfc4 n=2 Tax=Tilletia TaxID=13289 RepID=A0A8X7MR38_9BASI|nr:hypothetical protein CF336_g5303 [Tilletia laevis]KAE8193883.1 hypothetical protein CF328_g4913 [Tilletia controversa]KAE8256555.1 hypothetical protein A4X03_0g5289 [Tilletia caries]KAE8197232.1 hypothetical protein CF335_g4670 [Tilletia laevis]KAE8246090.1 hypothetical protein A4X06_0g5196 [Tilletia controversa]
MSTRASKRTREEEQDGGGGGGGGGGYGQQAQAVYTQAEAGPSRERMLGTAAQDDDEDEDEDEWEDEDGDYMFYDEDADDSADEYREDQEEGDDDHEDGHEGEEGDDDDSGDSGDDDGDDDDAYPAAPDLDALRLAEQYSHPYGVAQPPPPPVSSHDGPHAFPTDSDSPAGGGADGGAASPLHDAAIDPAFQQQSRYRAGGMQRMEELGFVGADEDVQVGEDEIARLVAAIQGDEGASGRAGRSQAASSSRADENTESGMRLEPGRKPSVRRWDQAMIQEKEDFEDELRGAHGMKRKRTRRTRNAPRQQALSAEIKDHLSEANSDYVMGNWEDAIASLHEIISIEPYARAAWTLLMLCFREKEQHAEAVQAGIILASLSSDSTAVEMFKELADSSRQLGARQQAIYCLQQAIIRSGKTDTDAMWDRAILLEQLRDTRGAARGYAMIVELRPWDHEAKEAAIRLYFGQQEYRRGAALMDVVRKWMMQRFSNPAGSESSDGRSRAVGDAPDPVQIELMAANQSTRAQEGDHSGDADRGSAVEHPGNEDEVKSNTYTEMDLYSHVEFLLYAKEPIQAITVLRETVRWLQGRAEESYWDDLEFDDREFDEVRPGREDQVFDEEDDDEGRRAFNRSTDLLAAGRRRRRLRKEKGGGNGRAGGKSANRQDEDPADDDDERSDGEPDRDGDRDDGEEGVGDDADADADADQEKEMANDIELIARRRQWEAWESRAPVFGMSPSLRVLLGRARLMIGDEDEAERQFSIVLEHDVAVHSDLFADVAQAYMEYGYWQEAFDVLTEMDRIEGLRTAQYYEWLGTCCQNLGKLQQAAKYLQGVVDVRPTELKVRYQLAEVYAELGDNDNALRLAASLLKIGRERIGRAALSSAQETTKEPSGSFFSMTASADLDIEMDTFNSGDTSTQEKKRSNRRGRPPKSRGSAARGEDTGPTQREKLEAIRELEYKAATAKLTELDSTLFEGDWWRPEVKFVDDEGTAGVEEEAPAPMTAEPTSSWDLFKQRQAQHRSVSQSATLLAARKKEREQEARRIEACKQWLDIASNLIDGFKNKRGMFKRGAGAPLLAKRFGRRGPNQGTDIQSRATALLARLQDRMVEDADSYNDYENYGLPEFRGMHFDDWAVLFMKYAFVLTKVGEWETALEHLRLVSASYTMQLHDRRRLMLSICTISCAMYAHDFRTVFSELRVLMSTYTFHDDLFRLGLSLANIGGLYGLGGFMNSGWLKFLLRRVRQWHAIAHGVSHSMRNGKWSVHAKFGKPRHLSNLENRQTIKRVPLGFANRMDELVNEHQGPTEPRRQLGERSDSDHDDDGEAAAGEEDNTIPDYKSLADVRPDRPGWDNTSSNLKTVTLQDILRGGYPSRPSIVAESFYGVLMQLSKSNTIALYFLTRQYSRTQSDPLICLLCGIAFLNRALNRQVDNRHHAALQGFAYLGHYRKLRAVDSQEVEYNLGRGFHQIGLLQQAEYHYERVLALAEAKEQGNSGEDSSSPQAEAQTQHEGIARSEGFGMAREAAFNLSLILASGGSPTRVRDLYERWLVVV